MDVESQCEKGDGLLWMSGPPSLVACSQKGRNKGAISLDCGLRFVRDGCEECETGLLNVRNRTRGQDEPR